MPAIDASTGVVFRVPGGQGEQEIAARASNVVDATRSTTLGVDGARVATVEHLLSALAGAGVTDCVVEVDGPELPIGDGSAIVWVDALTQAGLVPLGMGSEAAAVRPLELKESLLISGPDGAFICAFPARSLRVIVAAVYPNHALVGTQVARFDPANGNVYATDIAPARTYGFAHEVEALRQAGLARGGALDNAVVVYEDHYSTPLRFANELARHKLLDLLGDLFLAGTAVAADIVAVKPGHGLNTRFAQVLERLAAGPGKAEPRSGTPSGSPAALAL